MVVAADIFNKVPPHGLVHDWLGSEAVARLLHFAQSNEECFEDTWVTGGGVDLSHRVSRKLPKIDNLKNELLPKLKDLFPVIFDKLKNEPFTPSKMKWNWLRMVMVLFSRAISIQLKTVAVG